jgi:hypothetical protein
LQIADFGLQIFSTREICGAHTGMGRLFITPDRRLALFWRVLFYVVIFFAVAVASNVIGVGLRALRLPRALESFVLTLVLNYGQVGV